MSSSAAISCSAPAPSSPPSPRSRMVKLVRLYDGNGSTAKKSFHMFPPAPPLVQEGQYTTQQPNDNDVLAGRGTKINKFSGNVALREFLMPFKLFYMNKNTKLNAKANLCALAVEHVRQLDPPGRFLARCPSDETTWVEMGDERARRKVAQILREDAVSVRAHLGMPQQSPSRKDMAKKNQLAKQESFKNKTPSIFADPVMMKEEFPLCSPKNTDFHIDWDHDTDSSLHLNSSTSCKKRRVQEENEGSIIGTSDNTAGANKRIFFNEQHNDLIPVRDEDIIDLCKKICAPEDNKDWNSLNQNSTTNRGRFHFPFNCAVGGSANMTRSQIISPPSNIIFENSSNNLFDNDLNRINTTDFENVQAICQEQHYKHQQSCLEDANVDLSLVPDPCESTISSDISVKQKKVEDLKKDHLTTLLEKQRQLIKAQQSVLKQQLHYIALANQKKPRQLTKP